MINGKKISALLMLAFAISAHAMEMENSNTLKLEKNYYRFLGQDVIKEIAIGENKLRVFDRRLKWNEEDTQMLKELAEKNDISASISYDGKFLAFGDNQGFIKIINIDTKKTLIKKRGHEKPVVYVEFRRNI